MDSESYSKYNVATFSIIVQTYAKSIFTKVYKSYKSGDLKWALQKFLSDFNNRAAGAFPSTAEDTRGMRKSMSGKRYIHIYEGVPDKTRLRGGGMAGINAHLCGYWSDCDKK